MAETVSNKHSIRGKIKKKIFRYIQILLCSVLTVGCIFPLIWLINISLLK